MSLLAILDPHPWWIPIAFGVPVYTGLFWKMHQLRTEERRGRNPEDTSATERAEASSSDVR
jgi:hypothetical protein